MIPKIIHHVWPGSDVFKQKFHKFRKSWLHYHPDWTFYFWRLDNLPSNIDQRVLKILNNPKYSITIKSDVLRFEIVKIFGGIYVDTDMECLKPLDKLLSHKFFTGKECQNYMCPSIFGAEKNNQILIEILNQVIHNLENIDINYSNQCPNAVSGPHPFTYILKSKTFKEITPFTDILENKTSEEITIYSPEYFYPVSWADRDVPGIYNNLNSSYSVHYWSGEDADGWRKTIKFNT